FIEVGSGLFVAPVVRLMILRGGPFIKSPFTALGSRVFIHAFSHSSKLGSRRNKKSPIASRKGIWLEVGSGFEPL
ncbi:MAG: hypothetical protein QNK35_03860, partial [Bacteroides sp.]|nr:hypothetical protein [Bacteroides sp.]